MVVLVYDVDVEKVVAVIVAVLESDVLVMVVVLTTVEVVTDVKVRDTEVSEVRV